MIAPAAGITARCWSGVTAHLHRVKCKRPPKTGGLSELSSLQRRLDFKTPGFQQRLWNIFGVLVTPRPLTQAGRANVLVRGEFEFLHCLFKRSDDWDDRTNRLRLAPVRITASFCHI